MAQQYKTGLIITGDASGGIRAIKATESELGKLNQGFDRGGRQSKQFGADAARAGRQLSAIDQGASDASRGLAVLRTNVAGVAAAMATAFGAGSIINQAKLIADTDSLAKSIGMATGSLQAWDYAAQQAGLAGGQMGDILKDITERIGEFTAEGTGEAAALFENLNLNIEEMKRLAPDQQLLRIADAISTLETRGEKISYLERLGSDATLLLPLLDDNAAKLREFTNEAEMLGVAMSQVDINNAVEANRAMSQLTGTMDGFTNQIVADLGPGLAMAVGGLADFIQESGGAASILNEVKDVATLTAAVMAGRYAASMVASTRQMIERNAASAAAAAADERSMQMAVRRSAAEVTAAKRTLGRAVAEAQATKGKDAHTAALARLGVARQQAIAATAQHTVAVNANAAATQRATVVARAASGAYALIGGPLGVATLAATAFFMFRDSSDEVASSLANMDEPLESVIEDFKTLTTESQRAALIKWGDRQEEEADKARQALAKIREEVLSLGFENSTGAQARVFFDEINAGFETVESGAQSLDAMLTGLQEQLEIPEGVMRDLRLLASEYSAGRVSADQLGERLEALTNTFNDVSKGADNAGVSVNSGAPSEKTLQAWGTYNDRLRESIAAARDGGSALGAANRAMDSMGEGVNGVMRGYTAFLTVQDEVLKDQKKAQEESASAAKQAASESARAYEQAARAAKQSAKQQADALRGIQHEINPLTAEHDKYVERLGILEQALSDNTLTEEEYGEAVRWNAEQFTRAATGADDYEKQTESLISTYDRHNQRAHQLRDALEQINQRYRDGEINGDQYARMVGGIRDEMQQLALEAAPISKELARSWEEAANRINETFGDAFTGAYDSFEDFGDKLMDGVKRLIGEITYQATLEPIVIGVTTQARGALGIPGAGGQQGGGLDLNSMSSLQNGWSALKGGVSNIAWTGAGSSYGGTGWANAATQGTGATGFMGGSTANFSGMTGLASAGAGFAGSYAGRAAFGEGRDNDILETAGTLVGAYFGGPLGAAAGSFIGSALASLDKETKFSGRFGTTGTNDPSQYASSGKDGVFEHQDDGENFYGQSALGYTGFLDRGTKRLQRAGMGEDKGWAEELADAAVVRDNLAASLARTTDELEAMQAAVQGLEASSSTAGELIEFALNERPRAALEALSGQFGEFVRGLEGDFESVVQQAQVAQQAHTLLSSGMERLNLQFDATAVGAYESASGLAQYVGGVENMAAINDAYYNAAFSESERLSNSHQDLLQSFSAITDEAPRTVAELRTLVEAKSQNGEASQRLAYDLMALAPALKETNAAVRQAIEQQYQDVLGRAPDASGLDYWFDVVASGSLTLEDALSSIASSAEAAEYASNGAASGIDNMSEALRAREQLEKQLLQVQGNTDALRQLELDRLSELENAEIDNLTALQRRLWAIEDEQAAQQNAERAQQERIRGIEQESQAWARARNEMAGFGNSIDSWLAQHDATEQGMGTPRERLEASDADFWAQYEKALGGDRNAQQGITQYADRYIANLQEMYASSDPAVNGIAEIRDAMERLPELLTPEQFLADEFRGIVGEQTTQLGVMLDLNRDGVVSAIERSITSGWNNIDALKTTLYQEMQQLGAQSLTEQQVRAALAPHATDAEISRLIQRVDHNGDGIISQEEITGSRIAGLSMGIVSALESEFSGIDVDASGLIDYDEFRDAFAGMATDSSLEKLFQLIDKNGDGQISYLESIAASSLTLAEIGLGRQPGDTDDVLGGNPSDIDDIINQNPVSDPTAKKVNAAYHDVMGTDAKGFQITSWSMWLAEKESRANQLHQAVAWANLPAGGEEWLKERGLYGDGTVPKFANGGVFTNSIVSAPTLFNMGLMGEEDPEAIVPLSRGAGGRLGIDATGLMRLPDGPMQLPIPEMPPLPQFPQLGSADVLQVLNDVKRELMETRKESKSLQAENARLLEALGGAIEKHGNRSQRQRENQIDELQAINRNSKTRSKTP